MQTVGNEGRCFVLSAISCVKKKNLPAWTHGIDQSSSAVTDEKSGLANGAGYSPTASPRSHNRRRSTITVQENHELVLPNMDEDIAEEPSTPAAKSMPAMSSPETSGEEYACRGGSCMVGPFGNTLVEPLWEVEDGGLLIHEADFEDCERGRLDLDVAGSYSRNDAFHLTVDGLDITPPP